uniref:Uncharacterized protein n=1 Tax=Aegilops tauschii subsp. strangulata TaxID=200361 RepID=A0A453CKI5_AEGTS
RASLLPDFTWAAELFPRAPSGPEQIHTPPENRPLISPSPFFLLANYLLVLPQKNCSVFPCFSGWEFLRFFLVLLAGGEGRRRHGKGRSLLPLRRHE